jgi:hypothetical protein
MKRLLLLLALAASTLVIAPCTQATVLNYTALLNGPNESPANASPGTGFATIVIDDVLDTMQLNLTFANLIGATTAAHIHCCTAAPFAGTAGVATTTPTFSLFPLGVTSGTYHATLDLLSLSSYNPGFIGAHGGTAASAEAFLLSGIALNESYLNIHTTAFPGGEIRGFLVAVPEPGTAALLGIGLIGLGGFSGCFCRKRAA